MSFKKSDNNKKRINLESFPRCSNDLRSRNSDILEGDSTRVGASLAHIYFLENK